MKKLKISFGTGTIKLEQRVVEIEDYECEQDGVDKMIDQLEAAGEEGYFLKPEELVENGGDYHNDEYIIGGNHGRILYHGGSFNIESI